MSLNIIMWNDTKNYSTSGGVFKHPEHRRKDPEKVYSVAETAKLFAVDKRTVMKWLEEYEGESVIPPSGWFRLPRSGYIRIKTSAIVELQNKNI